MEKPFDKIDDVSRKLVKDAGLEKAPANLKFDVMDRIEKAKSEAKSYSPLLSRKSWLLVAIVVVGCLAIFYFLPSQEGSLVENLGLSEQLNFSGLSEIKISKTLIYGVGFMALFLIQIPFLKRRFERQYSE